MSARFRKNLCRSARLSAPLGQRKTASEEPDQARERGGGGERQETRHNTSLSLHCGSFHYISHTQLQEDNLTVEAVCCLFYIP